MESTSIKVKASALLPGLDAGRMSRTEMARALGCHPSYISKLRSIYELPSIVEIEMQGRSPFHAKIVALSKAGLLQTEIAKILGVTNKYVSATVKRYNLIPDRSRPCASCGKTFKPHRGGTNVCGDCKGKRRKNSGSLADQG